MDLYGKLPKNLQSRYYQLKSRATALTRTTNSFQFISEGNIECYSHDYWELKNASYYVFELSNCFYVGPVVIKRIRNSKLYGNYLLC